MLPIQQRMIYCVVSQLELDLVVSLSETPMRLPIGIPTSAEVTGEETLPDPAARIAAAEGIVGATGHPDTPPVVEPLQESANRDHQAERLQRDQERRQNDQQADQEQLAGHPEQAMTKSSISTYAGPRPRVDLTGQVDPSLIGQAK